jgi:zinc transport system substrate-binding protein
MRRTLAAARLVAAAVLLTALPAGVSAGGKGVVRVAVTVPPLAFFVEQIGGDRVALQAMIPRYASHETYEPTPRQVIALERSDLYVKVGVPSLTFEGKYIEPFLKKHGNIRVVNLSEGVSLRFMEHHHHEGEEEDTRGHGKEPDPHVWLSPAVVRAAAGRICQALCTIDPAGRESYVRNRDRFTGEIDLLDREIRDSLRGEKGLSFLVFHPAWGYFADEYGLVQNAIEEEGKTPDISRIRGLIDFARTKGIRIIFVQKGFDTKSAGLIAREIGGKVVEMDPLEENWTENLKRFSAVLRKAAR